MADVTMPQLGETVTEGTITQWFKQIGDQISEDEVLFEVSTDKVDSEVPSPVAGYLAEIRAPEGETVDVGEVIAVVSDEPPDGADQSEQGGDDAEAGAERGSADEAETSEDGGAAKAERSGDDGQETSAEQDHSEQDQREREPAQQDRRDGAGSDASDGSSDDRSSAGAGAGVLMSPLVRRLLDEHELDVSEITGTGAGGRITRDDVQAVISARREDRTTDRRRSAPSGDEPVPNRPSAPQQSSGRRPAPRPVQRGSGTETTEPLNNIRRRTGEHMVASKATSPHAMTAVEVDYEAVDRVRNREREAWREEEGFSLTYLPFIARAVIDALRSYPHINSSVGDGELVVHHDVNLAFAVDLDFEGLLAPVVHGADQMRLRAVARAVNDLAERARGRQLSADDISGGTFTISNSGSFGTHMVIPIINQPQVGILSTDGISRKPVVVTAADGTEAIAIHSVGLLAMSWDHRAFDGGYAAAFLRDVKEIIETRDWGAEL